MPKRSAVHRRDFLKVTATAAAGAACGRGRDGWRVLTTQEGDTLAAVCDTLIPPDQDPGAAAAGAVVFIDRQLAGRERRHRRAYSQGLRAVEATAQRVHGRAFTELTPETRTTLLASIERGDVPGDVWSAADTKAFFELVLSHTRMGFYGDPRHGGNRERASWKMLGIPDPPVRGRLHEPS
jgi:gluconate 2-dehydrogenase gamma chain